MAKKAPFKESTFPSEPTLIADTQVRGKPLAELGWAQGDPAGMEETRDYLAANNGIRGLERLQPKDIEDAVRIFYRDGFVVVENVLDEQQLRRLNQASERVIRDILAKDKNRRAIAAPIAIRLARRVSPVSCSTNPLGPCWWIYPP